jgi:hypothetical protein
MCADTLHKGDNDDDDDNLASMESGHLLTHSRLTLLEVSLRVSPGFFCLLFRGFLFSLSIYNEAFSVHVATHFFCIPV